jgi:hypothetical protein
MEENNKKNGMEKGYGAVYAYGSHKFSASGSSLYDMRSFL